MEIDRPWHLRRVRQLIRRSPAVAILGPRQVGKTTLADGVRRSWTGPVTAFDLEDPADVARLADPMLALRSLKGLVILDEVQRRPELFPVLRVLADRPRSPARFLVLGSASPDLLRQSSESLAGRLAFHELGGFSLDEVGAGRLDPLWLRGGFPRSFLARSGQGSLDGGSTSSARSWRATCRSSACRFPRRPCAASGRCWRITTGRCGTPRSSRGRLACPT